VDERQTGKAGPVSELPDLQETVRALRGVARASVRWPEPEGPATLHIVFSAEADREATVQGVLEALHRVGHVDLSSLRMDLPRPPGASPEPRNTASGVAPPPPPATAPREVAQRVAARRAVFSGMTVDRSDLDNRITVTLRIGDRTLTGRAEGLATRRATPRTAAAAALLALRDVLPGDTRLQLEWLEVVDALAADRPAVVQSAVTCLSAGGEQTYLGSAIVRDDLREAAVRATLDALNRRLEQHLTAGD
jgi:hypothetical protein